MASKGATRSRDISDCNDFKSWSKEATVKSFAFPFRVKTGITPYSESAVTIKDVFKLFFPNDISFKIIEATNERGQCLYGELWTKLTQQEFDCFIAINIAAGVLRLRKVSLENMFSQSDAFTPSIFQTAMSKYRFKQLKRSLRFMTEAEQASLVASGNNDKLGVMRWFHDAVGTLFEKAYTIGPDVTVDEQIMGFRGRAPAIVYMKNKPDKYGQKRWVLACAKSSYCYRWQMYLGKENNVREVGQAKRVVLDLTRGLPSGYNVTTDNFFTSVPLANELLQRGITLLGTMRQNKEDIPPALKTHVNRELYSTIFAFKNELMLASYCSSLTPKRNVILLSSQNQLTGIDDSTTEKKPHIILKYNKTKGGVDQLDKMIKEYSCRRISRKWTVNFFFHEIDVMIINAFIVWADKSKMTYSVRKNSRMPFMKALVMELIYDNLIDRFYNVHQTPREVRRSISVMLNIEESDVQEHQQNEANAKPVRKRCHKCRIVNKDTKTRYRCIKCKQYACLCHAKKAEIVTCIECQ